MIHVTLGLHTFDFFLCVLVVHVIVNEPVCTIASHLLKLVARVCEKWSFSQKTLHDLSD
jgi:hypothetical protein